MSESPPATPVNDADRRRRVRRTAVLLGLLAAAFYFGFIALALTRGVH
ncbi:MAG: hypothetical protein ABI885_04445 [Gammaproteobacteria bacterium]